MPVPRGQPLINHSIYPSIHSIYPACLHSMTHTHTHTHSSINNEHEPQQPPPLSLLLHPPLHAPTNSERRYVALKIVKSAKHYTETAEDEVQLLNRVRTARPGSSGQAHVVELLDCFYHTGAHGNRTFGSRRDRDHHDLSLLTHSLSLYLSISLSLSTQCISLSL